MIRSAMGRLIRTGRALSRHFVRNLDDLSLVARIGERTVAFRPGKVNGLSMLVRADEDVGRNIYLYNAYERDETKYFCSQLRIHDVCFDIGANAGYYTLMFASIAKCGTVHAFEPDQLNYHMLSVNVLSNRLSNCVLTRAAVGDFDGQAEFVEARDGAFSSLVDTGRRPRRLVTVVPMLNVDSYCLGAQVSRIDCMKVDVEGAEEKVVTGASQLLGNANRRPRLIMLELYEPMLRQHGSSIDAVLSLMDGYGYKPFIWTRGRRHRFVREHHNVYYNVFFSVE